MSKKIKLFWWSEIYLMNKPRENFGDLVGKYLVEKISKKRIIFVHPKKQKWKHYLQPIYATAGSILAHVTPQCIVWGSGIINKEQKVEAAKFLSVRGPQTRKRLLEQGYQVPELYGDPALLLPKYHAPIIKKSYKFGIVPHYVDFETVKHEFKDHNEIKVIDLMTNSIEEVIDQFLTCEKIYSSSLHGLIVAHAYKIPAIWIKPSDKLFGDDIKFQDYFESVGIQMYIPETSISLDSNDFKKHSQPNFQRIVDCQNDLMKSCPFK